MKKQLLKNIAAFIATAMLFSASANAQIVYTDVNPDTTINTNGGVYALDLNNDGITDFNITFNTTTIPQGTNRYIRITPLGANKVGNDLSYPYPSALSINTLIDSSSSSWLGNANQSLISRIWFIPWPRGGSPLWQNRGNWNGASDKYIPLQLDVSSQKYYGWARLDVATIAASFTVKDYAYNSIPNQSILAGDTGTVPTGIFENSFAASINLFPNPANNHLSITLGSDNKNVEVAIADITGKIVYTTSVYETNMIGVNTSEFAEGIYLVQIQSGEFISTKKLIIKK